ncbi:MAG: hypothetical protein GY860_02300, partial [Desulfobacteraceae bacterium]|nr:hypothetical protein [Desulfobacteraceae bacterium]
PALLEVIRNQPTPYFKISEIKTEGLFEQTDQDTLKFTHKLTAGSKAKIQYKVTSFKGERRWQQ